MSLIALSLFNNFAAVPVGGRVTSVAGSEAEQAFVKLPVTIVHGDN